MTSQTSSLLQSKSKNRKGKKRKRATIDDDDGFLEIKNLLPIKTKQGLIVTQQRLIRESDIHEREEKKENNEANDINDDMDEEMECLENSELDLSQPLTAAQLLSARNSILQQRKLHIGILSSGLLENPEEKLNNLHTLLKLMDEDTAEVYLTVRKLIIASLVEIFKDILPSYEVKPVYNEDVKLKKDTLKLHKYEENLLQYYKKFLQKLEKLCFTLKKKKDNTRLQSEKENKLGEVAVKAMCDLIVANSYFNFSENIAKVIVIFLNYREKNIRHIVKAAIITVFKEDKKKEMTLKILRIINQFMKTHSHINHTEILEVLLVLNLKHVNLDFNDNKEIKQKKYLANKYKIIRQTSKKEKKRQKKLALLEKEMLETKAEENQQAKLNIKKFEKLSNFGNMSRGIGKVLLNQLWESSYEKEISIIILYVLYIYTNMEISRFAHCINLEYYIDIVNVLDRLLKEDWLGNREQLYCIQTVFAILSGQGESLNLDPTKFYINLYKDLLNTTASKNHEEFLIAIKTLNDALIKRRKQITNKRVIGFVKRLTNLTMHLLHNGALSSLALVRNIMQFNNSVDILLDLDSSFGDGNYQPELDDPEYSNASSTALYELNILSKHYHPTVSKFAENLAKGNDTNDWKNFMLEYGKLTSEDWFNYFSMSEMAFNPSISVPKKVNLNARVKHQTLINSDFSDYCKQIMRKQIKEHGKLL